MKIFHIENFVGGRNGEAGVEVKLYKTDKVSCAVVLVAALAVCSALFLPHRFVPCSKNVRRPSFTEYQFLFIQEAVAKTVGALEEPSHRQLALTRHRLSSSVHLTNIIKFGSILPHHGSQHYLSNWWNGFSVIADNRPNSSHTHSSRDNNLQ